jgi:hypothetical protein
MTEYRHFRFTGTLLQPKLAGIGDAKATLMASPELDHASALPRQSIGVLRLNEHALEAFLSMPSSAASLILQMLLAERFKYLCVEGSGFRSNHAEALSLSFREQASF